MPLSDPGTPGSLPGSRDDSTQVVIERGPREGGEKENRFAYGPLTRVDTGARFDLPAPRGTPIFRLPQLQPFHPPPRT